MLKVTELSKKFQADTGEIKAVDNVSFEVKQGEVYGLIGLSGAGKSSLVRCLNLLERPDSGQILFNGTDICKLNNIELANTRRDIGMIFQHFNLLEQKTVYDNIAFPLLLHNKNKGDIDKRVKDLLSYVELESKINAYPAELSGGQKQRVAIARTLANSPKLLLSDEGTSALDPKTTMSILELLRKTVKDMGLTIVLITHQMEVARNICDRIGVMEAGKIVEENSVEELFLRPTHPRTKSFVQGLSDSEYDKVHPQPIDGSKLYRLSFHGSSVTTPIISYISREFKVDANLLAGNIHSLYVDKVGYLTVELLGENANVQAALAWLAENQVIVEEIQ